MAMGRQKDGQGDLMVSWSEMPRSPGHVFYDPLQWGKRVRLRDSQEWSGTRSRLPSRRNARSKSESEQRHSSPRSLAMPSK